MSLAKKAWSKNRAKLCRCGRKALSAVMGRDWKWRWDHPLCAQCKRSLDASLRRPPPRADRHPSALLLRALGADALEVSAGGAAARNDDVESAPLHGDEARPEEASESGVSRVARRASR
jgi:hypothetical protein